MAATMNDVVTSRFTPTTPYDLRVTVCPSIVHTWRSFIDNSLRCKVASIVAPLTALNQIH
jgi:hypothetical protein